MARFQIEPNADDDPTLPGGRHTLHRLTLVVSPDEVHDLANGKPLQAKVDLPAITVNRLVLDIMVAA